MSNQIRLRIAPAHGGKVMYCYNEGPRWHLVQEDGVAQELRRITDQPVLLGFALLDALTSGDNPGGVALAVTKAFCPDCKINMIHTVKGPPAPEAKPAAQPVEIPEGLLSLCTAAGSA